MMLYSDCIEKLLQLEDVIVTNIECVKKEMHIYLRMQQRYHICPECGKRFYEEVDFLPRYHRFTNRVFMQIMRQLKECRSIKSIAEANNMSAPTAAKIIDLIEHTADELPEVLSIDEFRGNAEGEKFQCILADPENHRILDILPTRKHEDIYRYLGGFKDRKRVKVVVMDMTGGYKSLMKRLFPDAVIVIDKYHYVRQVGFAIEKIRIEEQKQYSDKWRKYFKRSRTLLLKKPSRFTIEDRLQLDNMLGISSRLKTAYELKRQFEHFKESKTKDEARLRLARFIVNAQDSGLEPFVQVSYTFQRWSKEILASFEYPYTNGYIEGCNNKIKVLKRVSL